MQRRLASRLSAGLLLLLTLACASGKPNAPTSSSGAAQATPAASVASFAARGTAAPKATATLAATTAPATAEAEAAPAEATVDLVINLRAGPSTAFPTVRKLRAGTKVTLLGVYKERGERWFQVRAGDREGWVRSDVLPVDPALASALPVSTETFTLPPTVTPLPPVANAEAHNRRQPCAQPEQRPTLRRNRRRWDARQGNGARRLLAPRRRRDVGVLPVASAAR